MTTLPTPEHRNDSKSAKGLALRNRVLEASLVFNRALSHELELEALCDRVVELVTVLFEAESTSLLFLDEDTSALFVKRHADTNGIADPPHESASIPGIAGTALDQQRLLRNVVDGMVVIAAPLIAERRVKGVLQLAWAKDNRRPTDEDEHLLEVLSGQVAAAIDNAWLYNEISRLNESLEEKVIERTHELGESNRRLEQTLSELKQAETRLIQHEKMASLGQLTAGVAHEINNPLAYSINNVELALRRLDGLEKLHQLQKLTEGLDSNQGASQAEQKALAFIRNLAESPDYKSDVESFLSELDGLSADGSMALTRRFLDYVTLRETHSESIDIVIPKLRHLIERSHDGLGRVGIIVDNLRRFSRLDSAQFETVSIDDNITSTLAIIAHLAREKDVHLAHKRGLARPYDCFAAQLNQVVLNLVTNAIQATNSGGKVQITTREATDGPQIEVTDTGYGISPENITRVFDPFFTTKDVGQGTGLGLSISYQIIEEHGGTIRVDSQEGQGSSFIIQLPPRSTEQKENQ